MVLCNNCEVELEEGDNYCYICGKDQPKLNEFKDIPLKSSFKVERYKDIPIRVSVDTDKAYKDIEIPPGSPIAEMLKSWKESFEIAEHVGKIRKRNWLGFKRKLTQYERATAITTLMLKSKTLPQKDKDMVVENYQEFQEIFEK